MVSDLHIQLATTADTNAIAAMSRTEIEQGLLYQWTPPRVHNAIKDAKTNVAVVHKHGCLAGFGIMRYDEDFAHLQLLAVHSTLRRQGIGSALLAWLEKVAFLAGVTKLGLEARKDNVAALTFYRKHGYRKTSTVLGMYQGLEDGIRLEKLITRNRASEE